MPSSLAADAATEPSERPSERRAREKRERDPNKPKKPRSSKPRRIDPETGLPVRRRKREKEKEKEREGEMNVGSEPSASMADLVPELSRTALAPGASRETLPPYPSLSKAHSKDAVYSRVDLNKPDVYTPEPTDIEAHKARGSQESLKAKGARGSQESLKRQGPLTPPDTELSAQRKSSTSTPARAAKIREEEAKGSRPSSRGSERSWFGRPKVMRDDRSKVSTKSKDSRGTARKSSRPRVDVVEAVEDEYLSDEGQSRSGFDSNATSIAPKRTQPQQVAAGFGRRPPGLDTDSGQSNRESASPRTPTATPKFDAHDPKNFARDFRPTPSPFVNFDVPGGGQQQSNFNSPLPHPAPTTRLLLAVTPSYNTTPYLGRASAPAPPDIEKVFGPFYSLLDQYETVLDKNGSVAVATGYRSIARKLLDRLENVFARELSAEGCTCIMCSSDPDARLYHARALGWGDVLEWVSGRRSLPPYPAFDFGATTTGLGLPSPLTDDGRPSSPQKIDPDIAEEFREHYLRQSKKTKAVVDKWLSATPGTAAPPPPDIDDDTLSFTVLTHLPTPSRPIFSALLAGSATATTTRAPTPAPKVRSEFIAKTTLAIQRLYRLPTAPRDPEAAIYLLHNPSLHHLLTTLSLINIAEWEILISGRFDGFLWSGADLDAAATSSPFSDPNFPSPPSRGPTPSSAAPPSRGPTPAGRYPFSPPPLRNAFDTSPPSSRNPTPSAFPPPSIPGTPFQGGRHPVSSDEDAEIAVLAEIERDIYAGMEALEDAFEALHRKAEVVRQALRQRGAGLAMAAQSRRGGAGIGVRAATPGGESAAGGWGGANGGGGWQEEESESGSEWAEEEIAPDDSASNISSSRHRRPKRRNERRTPALVEEEDEG
ncbi:hypothetical protein GMDG_01233 [Pseudogymnoascus destructans 20631-21]|uniref:5-Methylcytosine G/T mismatch-specific DNA glycosylase n=1 Tax=Pseudogymnoascus destructans (strain ATCC MYA-4855 / 20631-21) TaxID=658429 RepID=L8FQK5_PSED2|nr:hypothetical protein GMDG_01233 [Pseudogymnoascus destructans 20631-21]